MRGTMEPDELVQNPPEAIVEVPAVQQNQSTSPIDELVRSTLAENERRVINAENRARELEDQLTIMKQNNSSTPTPVPEKVTNDAFWQNPVESISKLINSQIAPLSEFTRQTQVRNAYGELKNQYRGYPGFAAIEPEVDQIMSNQMPTHDNMKIAIQRAVGYLILNDPKRLQSLVNPAPVNPPVTENTNPPAPTTPPVQTNAHLRPSTNTQRAVDNKPKVRELTENERRLAREWGMTPEQYIASLNDGVKVSEWVKGGKK